MTTAEMNRRLNEMPVALIDDVKKMISQGYGAQGIKNSTVATLKQVNAVFQLVQGR